MKHESRSWIDGVAGARRSADDAADLLQRVSTAMTQWSIVYELACLEVHLVVERDAEDVHAYSVSGGSYLIPGMQAFPNDPQREKSDVLLTKVDTDSRELWSTTIGEPDTIENRAFLIPIVFCAHGVRISWLSFCNAHETMKVDAPSVMLV